MKTEGGKEGSDFTVAFNKTKKINGKNIYSNWSLA